MDFLLEHPLRDELTCEDIERIQAAIDDKDYDNLTPEELDAALDIFYDAIAAKLQTHEGSLVLQ